MRLLLSSLMIGGAVIPSTISSANTLQVKNNPITVPMDQDRIWFDSIQKIEVWEGQNTWSVNFTTPLSEINNIYFDGGGLFSQVEWDSNQFNHNWDRLENFPNGPVVKIFSEENVSGKAKQRTILSGQLANIGKNGDKYSYKLTFSYLVVSQNGNDDATGVLTIGNSLTFIGH